ncbi:hypothetical protein BGW41_002710 [Actinomortierella wolfii]|nr:hypothetical protein BGW41_002710 [Actinomortierella wolfii]
MSAVDSDGMVYQTDVSFPPEYIISPVPSSCTASSDNQFECRSSGNPLFSVTFPNVTTSSSTSGVQPVIYYVGIDGETCSQQTSCPQLSPSNGSNSSSSPSSTGKPAPTQTSKPTDITDFNSTPGDNKKATIIGVAVAVVIVVLIALCIVLRRNTTSVSSTGLTRKNSMHQRLARRSGDGVPAGGPGSFGGPDGYALYRQRTMNRARSVRDLQEKAAAAAAAAAMRNREGVGSSTAGLTTSFGSASEISEYSHGGGIDSRAEMGLARHPSTRTYSSLKTARSMASNASSGQVNVFEDSRYTTDDRALQEKYDDIQLEPTSPTEPRNGSPTNMSPLSRTLSGRQTNGGGNVTQAPPAQPLARKPSETANSKSVGFVDMDREEMKADRAPALHRSVSQSRPRSPPVLYLDPGRSTASLAQEAANLQTVEATRGLQRSLSTKERRELEQHRAHASRHIMRPDSDD